MSIGTVDTPGTEYPAKTIYTNDDSGTYYVPFIADDGRVGYRVGIAREADGPRGEEASWETFIYLNPSTSIDASAPDRGDVFVYVGIENDPAQDEPITFIAIDDDSFGAE